MQLASHQDVPEDARVLAWAYVAALASRDGAAMTTMPSPLTDHVDQILDVTVDDEGKPQGPWIRADMAAAAALTARAIATEPGLAKRLREEGPIVAIRTHTAEMTDLVDDVITHCATREGRRKKIVARDGTQGIHVPSRGNDDVIAALSQRWPIVGVSPDPQRHLPKALMRTAEYRLSLPAFDDWTLRFVLEVVTGGVYQGEINAEVIQAIEVSDLCRPTRPDRRRVPRPLGGTSQDQGR